MSIAIVIFGGLPGAVGLVLNPKGLVSQSGTQQKSKADSVNTTRKSAISLLSTKQRQVPYAGNYGYDPYGYNAYGVNPYGYNSYQYGPTVYAPYDYDLYGRPITLSATSSPHGEITSRSFGGEEYNFQDPQTMKQPQSNYEFGAIDGALPSRNPPGVHFQPLPPQLGDPSTGQARNMLGEKHAPMDYMKYDPWVIKDHMMEKDEKDEEEKKDEEVPRSTRAASREISPGVERQIRDTIQKAGVKAAVLERTTQWTDWRNQMENS